MDKQTERFIINNYIDIRKLLSSLGLHVSPNNTMFCPFHDNTRTPSAHLYDDDNNGATIFCYAEHKLYTTYDLYKVYLPDLDTNQLAQALFDRLSEEEKDFVKSNINKEIELPELPYIESLKRFKDRQISFEDLLKDINLQVPVNETTVLLDSIYSTKALDIPVNKNKYVYFIKNHETQYKVVSAISILNSKLNIPDFLVQYLQRNGDCIIIPNKIGQVIYSLTFRNIQGKKQFLKVGDVSHTLYNLGNLPKDFKYGVPLILVEGNLDCDVMKEIYPYTVASLTASLSTNQLQLLSHLTSKVIIAYDNDDAGLEGFFIARKRLMELGVSVKKFTHNDKLHDLGDLIDIQIKDKDEYNYLIRSYRNQIESKL